MDNLFRRGAFFGSNPREAYFVKCDGETTTQADIDLGIVNIIVGFKPVLPASTMPASGWLGCSRSARRVAPSPRSSAWRSRARTSPAR